MGDAKTYDLLSVAVAVDGVPIGGFQDGDAVSIEFNQDAFNLAVGSDGEQVFSKTNDQSGTVTFQLLYSSRANAIFSELARLDRQNNGGLTSITIRDLIGGSRIHARNARVGKVPDVTLGRDAPTMEWPFKCGEILADWQGLPAEVP